MKPNRTHYLTYNNYWYALRRWRARLAPPGPPKEIVEVVTEFSMWSAAAPRGEFPEFLNSDWLWYGVTSNNNINQVILEFNPPETPEGYQVKEVRLKTAAAAPETYRMTSTSEIWVTASDVVEPIDAYKAVIGGPLKIVGKTLYDGSKPLDMLIANAPGSKYLTLIESGAATGSSNPATPGPTLRFEKDFSLEFTFEKIEVDQDLFGLWDSGYISEDLWLGANPETTEQREIVIAIDLPALAPGEDYDTVTVECQSMPLEEHGPVSSHSTLGFFRQGTEDLFVTPNSSIADGSVSWQFGTRMIIEVKIPPTAVAGKAYIVLAHDNSGEAGAYIKYPRDFKYTVKHIPASGTLVARPKMHNSYYSDVRDGPIAGDNDWLLQVHGSPNRNDQIVLEFDLPEAPPGRKFVGFRFSAVYPMVAEGPPEDLHIYIYDEVNGMQPSSPATEAWWSPTSPNTSSYGGTLAAGEWTGELWLDQDPSGKAYLTLVADTSLAPGITSGPIYTYTVGDFTVELDYARN